MRTAVGAAKFAFPRSQSQLKACRLQILASLNDEKREIAVHLTRGSDS